MLLLFTPLRCVVWSWVVLCFWFLYKMCNWFLLIFGVIVILFLFHQCFCKSWKDSYLSLYLPNSDEMNNLVSSKKKVKKMNK